MHLKPIVVPDGTTQLGDAALGAVPDIRIPASVRIIGSYVVNPYMQKVTIDSQNRKFKMKDSMLYSKDERVLYGAFGYCKKLKSIGKMPKLKYIGKGAFWGCKKLKFKPGKKVKIAKHAFTVKGK